MRWLLATFLCASGLIVCCAVAACGRGGSNGERLVTVDIGPDIAALASDDLFESEPAADRIVAIGKPTIPILARALAVETVPIRVAIVDLLQRIGGPEVVPIIASAAADGDATIRYESVIALGKLGDPNAATIVERALQDSDGKVRAAAANACVSVCDTVRSLGDLVDIAIYDEASVAAMTARTSLVRILAGGESPRRRAAREAVAERALPAIDGVGSPEARARAALLASDIGDARGARTLLRAVTESDSPQIVVRAVYALGEVGEADAVPTLAAFSVRPGVGLYGYDALRRMAARGVAGAAEALAAYVGPRPPGPVPPP